MKQAKLIKSGAVSTFEENLNQFLEEIINFRLIDVKFSTTYNDSAVVYSALVIYEV
ncbi:sporulation protein Cse60 [Bacillus sp. FJAT-27225]|uniref:sporulation protein Cse60 n=1 Tax=Bacillus sp. FJAT-27225 TaxID=1743144 RepID=UPI00158606BD|nr:sporulation protein Cse60 [Bacillus sp. FJAT-27225]